jgi:hypothetical protein
MRMRFAFNIDFGAQAILNDVLTGAMAGTAVGRNVSVTMHVVKAGLMSRAAAYGSGGGAPAPDSRPIRPRHH